MGSSTSRRSLRFATRLVTTATIAAAAAGFGLRAGSAQTAATKPAVDTQDLTASLMTGGYAGGTPGSVTVTRDEKIYFLRAGASRGGVRQLLEFDPATKTEKPLLPADLLETLAAATGPASAPATGPASRPRPRPVGGVSSYTLTPDEKSMLLSINGNLCVLRKDDAGNWAATPFRHRGSGTLTQDGKRLLFLRADALWQKDVDTGAEQAVSPAASGNLTFGSAEYIAQEEFSRSRGYWVSGDSQFAAYQETDVGPVDKLYVGSPLTPDEMPSLRRYPRAGRPNANVRLFIKSLATDAAPMLLDWDHAAYPYLTYASWGATEVVHGGAATPGSRDNGGAVPLTFTVMNRLQTEAVAYAVLGGKVMEIAREHDDGWVNVERIPLFLPSGKQFLWISEASGEPQLQLRTVSMGESDKTVPPVILTPRGLGLQDIVSVDEARRVVYVLAHPNPTQKQLYRVDFNGDAAPVRLSTEPGIHRVAIAPGGGLFADTLSAIAGPVTTTLRREGTDAPVSVLKSFAEAPKRKVDLELTTVPNAVGDDLQVAIVRPKGFDPARSEKWPVLLNVYAGPGVTTVHGNWREYITEQWFADSIGAVVVSIDGRGSPGRGSKWERSIKGNLADIPMEDQVTGLKAVLAKHPELDAARVGVWGWSFGGYMSCMLAMREPGLIKAAAAGAPVSDWKDYDTAYTERYLGLPDATLLPYVNSSLFKWSADLRVPLIVFHGTADDNVLFTASARLAADALRNRTPLQLIALPGMSHGMSAAAYLPIHVKVVDFFREQFAK